MKTKKKMRFDYWTVIFIAPALIFYLLFLIIPAVSSTYYSFTSWNGLDKAMNFVGLANYKELLNPSNTRFIGAMIRTFIVAIAVALGSNIIALILAILVDRIKICKGFFRSAFYIPVLISGIVSGFIWKIMYNTNFGVFNHILSAIGLDQLKNDWLGNPRTALASVILTVLWQGVGYYMIIYLAGLQSVPEELMEAAEMDGATSWKKFWRVTFPMLAGSITINMTLALINGMKVFDQISVMTSGGPGFSTETMTYYIFKVAFGESRQGLGTAASIILFIFILVFNQIQSKALRSREVEM
ncbi:MAG TPA: sugar ABC transporter permease [Candidatus Pelethocola excrementipullorum]|nr:sugar ABC transporter permease [Candidatus Pelethocola excrementipullorum]